MSVLKCIYIYMICFYLRISVEHEFKNAYKLVAEKLINFDFNPLLHAFFFRRFLRYSLR